MGNTSTHVCGLSRKRPGSFENAPSRYQPLSDWSRVSTSGSMIRQHVRVTSRLSTLHWVCHRMDSGTTLPHFFSNWDGAPLGRSIAAADVPSHPRKYIHYLSDPMPLS
ncbi:hypothetical protein DPMN_148268 [Dreissena polymorpha]|uniref:Uncharacterized protein n=1 Tax=Dreissena polymorpha TaxID=45954 RepID=A0A9D4FDN7_DREPO|nr:hypothetical protein DPMN_148268 [Dreissena polymorpha]